MQKLQEQLFNFPVTAELIQVGGKPLPVKGYPPGRGHQPFFCCTSGFMPSNKNSLTVSSGRWAFADYMFYSGLVDLITFNGAYFNKRLLRLSVIVRDQVGTGEVELLGIVLQNVGQLRYQLSQFDSFPYLILGDSKKFCDQCSGRILLAILARSFIISIRAIPLPVF